MKYRYIKICISLLYFYSRNLLRCIGVIIGFPRSSITEVIVYHEVLADDKRQFIDQIKQLKDKTSVVALDDVNIPGNGGYRVAITFDDAFRSIKENALPVLQEHKIPCTIFVPTWWTGKTAEWVGGDWSVDANQTVMTVEELKSVDSPLVALGSHGLKHQNMSEISEEEAWKELTQSKSDLEEITGQPVLSFAFPFGAFDTVHIEQCKRAGYSRVLSTLPSGIGETLIGRIDVSAQDSKLEFSLKISGAYRWLPMVVMLKRKIKSLFGSKRDQMLKLFEIAF